MAYRVPQLCDLIKTLEQHLFVDKEALELGPGDFRNDCVLKLPEIKVFELRTKPSKVGYVERRVLLHSTLDALIEALARYGPPEIMNTDQGSQFTGSAWITTLTDAGVAISMDGRGRYMDNIFIERLWRSLKYEAVYLHELVDGFVAERVIGEWINFYNTERPHSALGGRTPAEAYGGRARQPQQNMINSIQAA